MRTLGTVTGVLHGTRSTRNVREIARFNKKSQGTEHLFDEKRGRKGDMGTQAMKGLLWKRDPVSLVYRS